ncbi:hypothetical protein L7F22_002922 [Adiantum nelumboides]|nr:hypothetical protein [Adiantum nelumboides]
MPNFPSTSHHEEEQQGPAQGGLDIRGDITQNIEDKPEEPAKEFLLHEKRVMESTALTYLQLDEQVKGFGHDFLPLPTMRHKAILWKGKMRPMLPRNEDGGYEDITLTTKQAQALVEDHPKWWKKWLQGEGPSIERDVEAWLDAMDDYFVAAGIASENQVMLGMFRLTGDAKLWWRQHCRDNTTSSPSWEGMKQAVKKRYLPPSHQALKMNEFYALQQLRLTLEEYYSKFISLRRYVSQMTMEQQIARFCQGLNRPLSTRLEAMRPASIQDALIRAKPLATEVNPFPRTCNQFKDFQGRSRRTS